MEPMILTPENKRDRAVRSKTNKKPAKPLILQGLFLLCLLMVGVALVQSTKRSLAAGQAPGTFEVKVSQGYLSLEATEAPLVQIFREIGNQGKITFDSNVGPEEKITIHLDQVPLEEGIKRLAKNVTVFYTENPKDEARQISRVVVLSEGSGVSGQLKASSQPEKASEPAPQQAKANKPAPQPKPFKFEFDPGKFAEKEKPRKQP